MLPAEIDAVGGVTAMDTSTIGVRTTPTEVTPLCEAVMVVVPAASPEATPEVLMVATEVLEEVHVAEFVRFCVVSSL